MSANLLATQYQNEDAARDYLEKLRWPRGPECPHCGLVGEAYALRARDGSRRPVRKGVYKCRGCRKQFTVTVKTIFSESKIPLHKWLLGIHLMCSSKKGISAHQLMRNLGLGSYRTAWFMAHRIRWALGQEPVAGRLRGIFEVDETFVGGKMRNFPGTKNLDNHRRDVRFLNPVANKTPVTAILQRDGDVRSITGKITGKTLRPALAEMIEKADAHIMTDRANKMKFGKYGWTHSAVDHHRKEYARHEDGLLISTNTVESYFAIVKRGINGIFHHVSAQYLDMYMREFDYRYNVRKMDDEERFELAVRKTADKRLTLKTPRSSCTPGFTGTPLTGNN
jgi:transposase-like protein